MENEWDDSRVGYRIITKEMKQPNELNFWEWFKSLFQKRI